MLAPCSYLFQELMKAHGHGRPVCRARGGGASAPPPRFCQANVKSLILTIGAPPKIYMSVNLHALTPIPFKIPIFGIKSQSILNSSIMIDTALK